MTLKQVPFDEIKSGKFYLVRIGPDWFVVAFQKGWGTVRHSCGGSNTMWERHDLSMLEEFRHLKAVYELPSEDIK